MFGKRKRTRAQGISGDREPDITQKANAGRDAWVVGGDQTIVNKSNSAVIAVFIALALVGAAMGASAAYLIYRTPTNSPSTQYAARPIGPGLKVEEVEIARASNIDASLNDMPGIMPGGPDKDTGSAIDITLRNNGSAPALIVKAIFSFTRIAELDSCPGGAGAAAWTAEYDVKVPTSKAALANGSLTLSRDMRFVVGVNSIDRFRISVGPVGYSSVSWPWIYEFKLSLVEDNGQKLDLRSMSILGFSASSKERMSWDPLQGVTRAEIIYAQALPCLTRDAAQLAQAVANPGLHSPELQAMYSEAKRLTANAPS